MTSEEMKACPNPEWRCFHCDEVFTNAEAAREHFSETEYREPACRLAERDGGLVALLRKQEQELDRFRSEDSESARQFYALGAEHVTALRKAEEAGYERGLADGMAFPRPGNGDAVGREDAVRALHEVQERVYGDTSMSDRARDLFGESWRAIRALPPAGEAGSDIKDYLTAFELIEADLEAGDIPAKTRVNLALSRVKAWIEFARATPPQKQTAEKEGEPR